MQTRSAIANTLHRQRMFQMKTRPGIAVGLLRVFVGVFFVAMTVAFLTVPFTLSSHPGEPALNPLNVDSSHLT